MTEPRKAPRERGNASPITRARIAADLTQAQLAQKVGCTQKDISRWEHGTHKPGAVYLIKLAAALDCNAADLM